MDTKWADLPVVARRHRNRAKNNLPAISLQQLNRCLINRVLDGKLFNPSTGCTHSTAVSWYENVKQCFPKPQCECRIISLCLNVRLCCCTPVKAKLLFDFKLRRKYGSSFNSALRWLSSLMLLLILTFIRMEGTWGQLANATKESQFLQHKFAT